MVTLKGRAATPVRPGVVVKGVLMGQIPLATGELVAEASISDLGAAYKEQVRQENTLRPKYKQLRGMTAFSFKTLFKFAQLLGLVELVREEPMQFPPPGGPLYSIRKPDGVHVVESTRRVFKLTGIGREDERSWTNLCRAWREQWPAPQVVEYAPPYIPPEKPPKPPEVVKPPEVFTPYKWVSRPSASQFKSLLAHLEMMRAIGVGDPAVASEIDRLSMLIGDWLMETEDWLEDTRVLARTADINRLELWHKQIVAVSEAFMDRDIDRAMEGLRGLTK